MEKEKRATEEKTKKKLNIPTNIVRVVRDQEGRGRGLIAAHAFTELEPIALHAIEKTKILKITKDKFKYLFHAKGYNGYIATGLAGFINDAVSADIVKELRACLTYGAVCKWVGKYEKYMEANTKDINAALTIVDGVALAVAVKDIVPATNILTRYGPGFFIEEVTMDPLADPWNRMACIGWLMRDDHFPSLAWAEGIWGVFDPITDKINVNTLYTEMKIPEKPTDVECSEICDQMLKALGLPPGGVEAWKKACEKIKLTGLGYELASVQPQKGIDIKLLGRLNR